MASKWWQSRGSQVGLEHWTLVHSRGGVDFTVFAWGGVQPKAVEPNTPPLPLLAVLMYTGEHTT